MPRNATRKATTTEIVRIHELLKENLQVMDPATEDHAALVRYKHGLTDESLAKLVSNTLPWTSVQRIRQELFGDLVRGGGRTSQSANDQRVAELSKEIAALSDEVAGLRSENESLKDTVATIQERFNKLVFALHQKGYTDTKHLLIKDAEGKVPGLAIKTNGAAAQVR